MSHKLLLALVVCVSFLSEAAVAADVVKWVDENGTTHFGNAQFAPSGAGEAVALQPANAMDAPNTDILRQHEVRMPMNAVTIDKKHKTNPRGWRGFDRRVPASSRRSQSRIRR